MNNRYVYHTLLTRLLLICSLILTSATGPAWANDAIGSDAIEDEPTPVATVTSININEASADSIANTLSGIGLTKAQRIVEFREVNGPFKRIEELALVKGIGEKTVQTNADLISLK